MVDSDEQVFSDDDLFSPNEDEEDEENEKPADTRYPVGKITEKAVCRNGFLTTWHCILSAELTKMHSF